jgi:hypothetical protein
MLVCCNRFKKDLGTEKKSLPILPCQDPTTKVSKNPNFRDKSIRRTKVIVRNGSHLTRYFLDDFIIQ